MKRLVTTVALSFLLISVAADAVADEGLLVARKVKLGLPPTRKAGVHRHSARLAVELGSLAAFDPELDEVSARVGTVTVFESAPGAPDSLWRARGDGRFVYRRPGARLKLDARTGDLRLAVKRIDLTAVEGAEPTDVPIVVRIGEAEFAVFVDFVVKRRSWRFVPSELTVFLDTHGGFSGDGDRDYRYIGSKLTVLDPRGDPGKRTAVLSAAQRKALAGAVEAVNWAKVPKTYLEPDEDCCCDQIVTDLTIRLGSVRKTTRWCSMSIEPGDFPSALLDLLDVLEEIGEQVLPGGS